MTDQARSTSPQDDRSRGFIEFDYVPYEDIVWGPKLGSGSFGCVYRGELRCSSARLNIIIRATSPRIDVGLGIGSADSSLMDTRNLSWHRCRAEGDSTVDRIRCVSLQPCPSSGIRHITLMLRYHLSPPTGTNTSSANTRSCANVDIPTSCSSSVYATHPIPTGESS